MAKLVLSVPQSVADFINSHKLTEREKIKQQVLLLYPYVLNGTISDGYISDLLKINRCDLMELYAEMDLPYIKYSAEELSKEQELMNSNER